MRITPAKVCEVVKAGAFKELEVKKRTELVRWLEN